MAGGVIHPAYHYKYLRWKVAMEFFGFNSSENFKAGMRGRDIFGRLRLRLQLRLQVKLFGGSDSGSGSGQNVTAPAAPPPAPAPMIKS